MNSKLLKFSLVCITGTIVAITNPGETAMAYETTVAGINLESVSSQSKTEGETTNLGLSEIPIPGFTNIGIANVDTNLLIRAGAGENYKIIGKLPKNGGCEILEASKDGWTKISARTESGKLTGYVKSEYLITGDEATRLAKQVGNYVAKANTGGLRVRVAPSTNSEILDLIGEGEELLVSNAKIVTDNKDYSIWVQVQLDSDENENGQYAYVARDFVDISFELAKAVSIQELQYGSGVSSTRVNLVNMAKEYLGDRYVWGGTTLGKGVDCSGFTQQIFKKFGIYISRTSRAQAQGGTSISASQLKAGDLVFYGSSSGNINHVAIYIGNGRIIHASNRRDGIKISNMNYRKPVKYVRYIKD